MTCTGTSYCRKTFEALFNIIHRVVLTQRFLIPLSLCANGSDPASVRIDDTAADLSASRQAELSCSFLAQLSD